jgi:hypothetical protein
MMLRLKSVCALTLLTVLLFGCSRTNVTEGLEPLITTIYQGTSENFPNPERGFHTTSNPPWEYRFDRTSRGWTAPLDLEMLRRGRDQGITLHAMRYTLRQFQTSDLSEEFLQRIERDLSTARRGGVKIILRFMYSVGYYGEDMPGGTDTSSFWMLRHLEQLKPIFVKHADVIAGMDAGFVGVWGEWHTSSSGLLSGFYKDNINTESRKVLDKLFEVLPKERMIRFRYPRQKSQHFHPAFSAKTGEDAWFDFTPVPQASSAFNKSNEARAGNHNDFFLTSEHDSTYGYDGQSELIANLKERVRQENLYVFQGGELDFGSGDSEQRAQCPGATAEFKKMRWSALNIIDGSNAKGFVDAWKQGGCYTTIARNLGYRFQLVSSSIPSSVSKRKNLVMSFNIKNVGYANPYNSRRLELVLRSKTTKQIYRIVLNNGTLTLTNQRYDPRFWQPGTTTKVTINTSLQSSIPTGGYDMLLNLPDPQSSLRNRPEYSIRLANVGVWENATGYNSLLRSITVNP